MMRWIVSTSLRYQFLVVALAVALMVFAIARLRQMPVDVFPEFAPPKVEIQTESPGMSTTEVEELLTVPLEEALSGTPNLQVMRSKTVPGLSSIVLLFKPGTDIWIARQLVDERIAMVVPELPNALNSAAVPFMLPPLSSTSRTMKIGLSSREISMIDLSTIAFWKIRPALMAVPGVANVAMWGERLQQIHVQVDPERLRAYGVTIDEVMEATADALEVGILPYANSYTPGAGGWIDTPNQRFGVQHVLPIKYPAELAQVPVKVIDGVPVTLGDLGDVKEDHPPLIGDAVVNDGAGLLLIVEKFPWGNTLEVTRGVEAAIAKLRPGLRGIEIDTTIFRPATFIELAMNNLTEALLLGAVLVVLVLLVFLWDWRVALISATIIPVSMLTSLLVLNLQGATVNVMVLAGMAIAIGAVVDDAIVDVENIVRRLRQLRLQGSDRSIVDTVRDASIEVRGAIIYASLIEISALLPVLFLEGLSGAFFRPLAQAYVVAGLVSPLVALTVTPALVLITQSRATRAHRQSPLLPVLHRAYDWVLTRVIHRPRLAYATVTVLVVGGFTVMPFLGQSLLPRFKETDFLMHWLPKPGTSHPETVRITTQASQELRAIPGVRNFGAHIGRALAADEVVGIYFTENWISVDPAVNYDATVAAIQATVDGYPGLVRDVQTYLQERIKEVLTGSSESIVVRIYGPELDLLRSKAEEVRQAMSEIDGIVDLHVALQVDIPEVDVTVNLAASERYGLKPGDIRRQAGALLASTEVGDIYRDGKAYDVAVFSTLQTRQSLNSIGELLISTPGGEPVRLGDVAEVRTVPTPNVVQRENVSRYISVEANVRGRDLGSAAREVERATRQIEFPLEYHAELLGEYAEFQAAQQRLLFAAAFAVLGIFFLLYTSFASWRLAILAFVTLPWALVGGLLATAAFGGVMSLGSLVGFLTILGIATRNGIMMISHFQHLEQEEGETFGPGLVLRGARERLAPILMTALTTGLALVPLVYFGSIPGHEIEYPMSIVILGGLVTSTLLNLLVVPTLYLRFGKPRRPAEAQ